MIGETWGYHASRLSFNPWKLTATNSRTNLVFETKAWLGAHLKGKTVTRWLPTTLLQISCNIIFNFKLMIKSIIYHWGHSSWLGVGLVISRLLVLFPAGALWSVLGQDSLFHIASVYLAAKWVPSINKAVLRACALYAANCSGISLGRLKWFPFVQAC